MIKVKIHEVAKSLNLKSADIVEALADFGGKPKTYNSSLMVNELDIVFDYFTQKHQVEEFTFILDKLKNRPAEPAAPEVSAETIAELNKPIKKEARYVDTRTSNVDLEKFNTEKIDKLVPVNVDEVSTQKQRIKKGPARTKYDKPSDDDQNKQREKKAKKETVTIEIPEELAVGEFAERLGQPAAEVVKRLMLLGVMASVSQMIDFDTAGLIAQDFGANVKKEIIVTEEDLLFNDVADSEEQLSPRSPVVVVMGHVDHGKTKLLDYIRKTNVIDTEAGGITQHIGAYRAHVNDKDITFLDTPGHEAFTAMRARGAQVTDVAILVVAADDGIMPQTVEAINHAKAAGISIIVAINKIDKEAANPDNVKQQLTEYGLVTEEWGGDTICVPVSALKGDNVDTLLEMVLLAADMKELKANPNRAAKGVVIESRLDKSKGPVATVLVQNGTLNVGDIIVAGTAVGRVRAMVDDKGRRIKKAGPSVPVEITGISEAPDGGEVFYAVEDEKKARDVVEKRKQKIKDMFNTSTQPVVSLDSLFDQIKQGQVKTLNLILKADVQGSVEALRQSLEKITNDEVRINIIHGGVGGITESDIMLASASNAIIIGFNVRPDAATADSASLKNVEIRLYRIIYQAIEEVEAAMKGMLEPTYRENVLGHAEIRRTFKVSGIGTIAGCYVLDGKITRNSEVRIVRDSIVIHEGKLDSLKRFKDDAKEVATGYECGIGIERFNDLKEGDIIESFVMEEVPR
ncbi:MAG: translation initiation factor IF-2 [Clostridiales bacterium]|jgi:translation initiation factor IF-2|nr:translation initiation factor IF-2 [Clostridiales bacterium]